MWGKLVINLFVSFSAGFGAAYQMSGNWKSALAGGVTAVFANQVGLHQSPPSKI